MLWFLGPSNGNSRIPQTDFIDPETETGSPEIELRVHGIHDALEEGLQRMFRSLVAPHKGSQRIISLRP